MEMFTVGDILTVKVIKALPDKDAYLTWVIGKELYAQLPKSHALKPYKVGENLMAAIMKIEGARIVLSQRIAQFTKKIIELEMVDLFKENNWQLKRAVVRPPVGKILVQSMNGETYEQMNQIFLQKKKNSNLISTYYEKIKLYLIPEVSDIQEQISLALKPAPSEQIHSIQVFGETASVYVSQEWIGAFMGAGARNLVTAKKLLGIEINLIAV